MKISHFWLFALPYVLLIVGMALNQTAVYANGGHMPVYLPGWNCGLISDDGPFHADWNHICMTHSTHLKFLGDWIIGNDGVSSIGDMLQSLSSNLKMPTLIAWVVLNVFGKSQ